MPLASLYRICLHRIYGLLKEGMWKFCITNPFSELPAQDVNNLMEMTLLHDSGDPPKFGDVILLLTSGRLTRLDLETFDPEEEQDLIVKVTQTRSSISMQNIASHSSKELFVFHLLRNIISSNPHLQEFYSEIHPGFDVFRQCQNLRILKIYDPLSDFLFDNVPIDFSVLSSLRHLEILHVFNMDADTRANVLDICPKLISIGRHDSLDSMEKIYQRRLDNSLWNFDVGRHFQLRRCVWGEEFYIENPEERRVYQSSFCDKMRFSVSLCPLVQELILYVHVKEAIKELRLLKQLNFLRISFDLCEGDFVPDFVTLLQEIGQQLKHLSILCRQPYIETNDGVPVDIICDCCTHLESLEIDQISFEPIFSTGVSRNLPLKRLSLRFFNDTDESLLFLLYNCKNLEELCLRTIGFLDDALLSQIFQRNPFTDLKVFFAELCSLTREGYQMLMEKAASIQTILIVSEEEYYFYDANRSFKDPNIHYFKPVYYNVRLKDFFDCRLDEKRF